MPWFLGGGLLAVVGSALMFTVDANTSNSAGYGYSALLGIGGGCFLMSAFGCVGAVVDDDAVDDFNAVGVLSVVQGLGIAFFVSTAGIIYQNLGVSYTAPYLPADLAGAKNDILAGASSLVYQTFPEDVRDAIDLAIIKAKSRVYSLFIVASALTAITAPISWRKDILIRISPECYQC
ncbi:major facilitator superfamily domain-containing protein [Apiospora saccharicola]|uniref:Major facilitator superfamily domain-containing protein n=1 Tax=Apiospora saccharicola TaxID=335842 RepID=A0ABR1WPQ0_9PEZI